MLYGVVHALYRCAVWAVCVGEDEYEGNSGRYTSGVLPNRYVLYVLHVCYVLCLLRVLARMVTETTMCISGVCLRSLPTMMSMSCVCFLCVLRDVSLLWDVCAVWTAVWAIVAQGKEGGNVD